MFECIKKLKSDKLHAINIPLSNVTIDNKNHDNNNHRIISYAADIASCEKFLLIYRHHHRHLICSQTYIMHEHINEYSEQDKIGSSGALTTA